jgi:hypothetical protein
MREVATANQTFSRSVSTKKNSISSRFPTQPTKRDPDQALSSERPTHFLGVKKAQRTTPDRCIRPPTGKQAVANPCSETCNAH